MDKAETREESSPKATWNDIRVESEAFQNFLAEDPLFRLAYAVCTLRAEDQHMYYDLMGYRQRLCEIYEMPPEIRKTEGAAAVRGGEAFGVFSSRPFASPSRDTRKQATDSPFPADARSEEVEPNEPNGGEGESVSGRGRPEALTGPARSPAEMHSPAGLVAHLRKCATSSTRLALGLAKEIVRAPEGDFSPEGDRQAAIGLVEFLEDDSNADRLCRFLQRWKPRVRDALSCLRVDDLLERPSMLSCLMAKNPFYYETLGRVMSARDDPGTVNECMRKLLLCIKREARGWP